MGKGEVNHTSKKRDGSSGSDLAKKKAKKIAAAKANHSSATETALYNIENKRKMPKIANKLKRGEIYTKWLAEKTKLKKELKDAKKEDAKNGITTPLTGKVQVTKTLENTREVEETLVASDDAEVLADEEDDEFAPYFSAAIKPKIMITTRPRPSQELFAFINCLMTLFPNSYFYPREDYELKDISVYARNKHFSHLIVLSEKAKVCNGMLVSHLGVPALSSGIWVDGDRKLPEEREEEEESEEEEEEEEVGDKGEDNKDDNEDSNDDSGSDSDADPDDFELPIDTELNRDPATTPPTEEKPGPTAFFRVANLVLPKKIPNKGKATSHIPEIILNNFTTRLGHRAGRFFGSLFPHEPEFKGRQAVTFHNQRDYVFVRHHRYMFEASGRKMDKGKTRAKLQELGPRFSLKMRWMLAGGFDTRFGEYEWFHKRKEFDTTRRKFHM